MQKTIDRYETKMNEMQKHIDSLTIINDAKREQYERLNIELTDFTYLHQNEMSAMKTDIKNLEERLIYNFNEDWTEMVEKLDKLDTRVSSQLNYLYEGIAGISP
jgi:LytS/YehU family sensor histidine kinase